MATMEIEVSYGQLAVFDSFLRQPYNDWTDSHVAQGFSWRPGSVSFRTLAEGPHAVVTATVDHVGDLHPEALRVIDVPFDCPQHGEIEVGSISETRHLTPPPGPCLLRCEFLRSTGESHERVHLTFAFGDVGRFSVPRADADLSLHGELLTTAEPASV